MYIKTLMAAAVLSVLAVSGARAELVTQSLPKPDMVGGKTLMQSLQERKSVREFGRRAVNDQTLADMLWAAVGVNQPGRQTNHPDRPQQPGFDGLCAQIRRRLAI